MQPPAPDNVTPDLAALRRKIDTWSAELGFQQLGITGIDLADDAERLDDWLQQGLHADMDYMAKHGAKRSEPALLEPGTVRVITLRMNYLAEPIGQARKKLDDGQTAYISRYAFGRDYHKVLRGRLRKLADRIRGEAPCHCRVFVDSAPVMEKALARNAGLGHFGKNSLILRRDVGSMFFLGEIYTDLALPVTEPAAQDDPCGRCSACISACPTDAILPGRRIDSRRCISYLTIENRGPIPEDLRSRIGNRVFGCDDCQIFCPWNRGAPITEESDFQPRHGLDSAALVDLFAWSESEFLSKTEGMALRRAGYEGWLRNLAVALGNAETSPRVIRALELRRDHESELVREHVHWALAQHEQRARLS